MKKIVKENVIFALDYIGGVVYLVGQTLYLLPKVFKRLYLFFLQFYFMGFESLLIVIVTSLFSGMIVAYQAWYQAQQYMPMVYIGMSVAKAMMIELGPLLTGLVVAGRVGSAMAAELGTMKVTEQIDALESLSINPVEYLVVPRVLSSIVILPILTIISEFVAILGGFFLSFVYLGVPAEVYFRGVRLNYFPITLYGGLIKSVTFGFVIAIMGCYHGLNTTGGAEGVGKSTTRSVVSAMVLILILDYLVSRLVFR
jgi:phospholipid/cholesterol/gamma-HCH transport system permease protein